MLTTVVCSMAERMTADGVVSGVGGAATVPAPGGRRPSAERRERREQARGESGAAATASARPFRRLPGDAHPRPVQTTSYSGLRRLGWGESIFNSGLLGQSAITLIIQSLTVLFRN